MSVVKLKRINNIIVKPVPLKVQRPEVLGYDYFKQPFCNIFLLAKKNSGKTTVIYEILKNILDNTLNQKVYFFVSTISKDYIYDKIKELLDNNEIDYECFNSVEDSETKQNHLVDALEDIKMTDKENFEFAENIFVFDDISEEISNKYIQKLCKENRHYKACVILSTQYVVDLKPSTRAQIDYCLAFKKLSNDNLRRLHHSLDIDLLFDDFINLYKKATEGEHNFLYIDRNNGTFRFNFNMECDIHSKNDEN